MNKNIRQSLKGFVPPTILKYIQLSSTKYGYFGNYDSWQNALKDSTGYDEDIILERVRQSLLSVKAGKAVYARDGVIFDRIYYSFPILAALFHIAVSSDRKLNLIDFGGSLGTSYYQFKNLLSELKEVNWSIVEQENFVTCGKEVFEDNNLKFFYDIDTCLEAMNSNTILLSGVIQCIERPYEILEKIISHNFQYILVDRTAFHLGDNDRLTIQKVQPEIYPASYPSWFLSLDKFLKFFQGKYETVYEFDALAGFIDIHNPYGKGIDKGFFFKRKI